MAYTIKRDVKPKRNAGGSGEFRKRSFSGSSRNSKKVDTRPGADRSERSYSDRPRSDRSEGGFKKREYSGAGSSYGTRPRTSEGSSERPRFGGSKFSRGPKTFGSRSGGSRGPSSNSRSGGRSGGRGPKGENIDASRFISRAESVTGVKEEVVKIDHKFADFALDAKLKEAIEKKGYITPTPIQDKTIPFILKGKDVVGLANTGSGKTAAFLLPLITKARLIPEEKVLILAPTRELAIQIADELKDFTSNQYMPFACCVGGMHIGKQIDQLRRPNNFVIGTPGRVKDLIQRKMIDTSKFGTIVLDEADRMLDMGFIDDMKWILSGFPKERQTLFFSATLSPAIEKLIHDFLKTPEHVSVRKRETSKNIDQDVIRVSRNEDKVQVLCKTLRAENCEKVIIFGRTKRGVETLSNNLAREGFKADSIHGYKKHSQRHRALKAFKEGRVDILVATDVAARGFDFPNVTHVINFETPQTYDDYVHRIGRTGRGDATGKAYTFVEHRG